MFKKLSSSRKKKGSEESLSAATAEDEEAEGGGGRGGGAGSGQGEAAKPSEVLRELFTLPVSPKYSVRLDKYFWLRKQPNKS